MTHPMVFINTPNCIFRLKEVADRIGRHGVNVPPGLSALRSLNIVECVVAPSHVAFLLEVCKYHVKYTLWNFNI